MKNDKNNFKTLSEVMNKMPAVVPVVGVGAAAASSMGDDASVQPSMQTGGQTMELDDEAIAWYKNNGYEVEEVMQDGSEVTDEEIANIDGDFADQYIQNLNPVVIEDYGPWADGLPYYNQLTDEQKNLLQKAYKEGTNSPITKAIRQEAKSGKKSNAGDLTDMIFAGAAAVPATAMNIMQIPQSLATEGLEQLRGNPYNYSNALDFDAFNKPVGKTWDTKQRTPSQTLLDKDAHWAAKFALDAIADPSNIIPMNLIRKGLKIPKALSGVKGIDHLYDASKRLKLSPSEIKRLELEEMAVYGKSKVKKSKLDKANKANNTESWNWLKEYDNVKDNLQDLKRKKRTAIGDIKHKVEISPLIKKVSDKFEEVEHAKLLELNLRNRIDPDQLNKKLGLNNKRLNKNKEIVIDNSTDFFKDTKAYKAEKELIDFTTGETLTSKVEGDFNVNKDTYSINNNKLNFKNESKNSKLYLPEKTKNVYDKNLDFTKNALPGFKPMGSSLFHKFNVAHATDDIDGIMKAEDFAKIKDKYAITGKDVKYGENIKLTNENLPGNPVVGDIDVNLIYTDPVTGKAKGGLATELYRQFFPDDFYNSNAELLKKNLTSNVNDFTINKTADEILEAYDPEIKTILDSFEAGEKGSTKSKFLNRTEYIIENGDPEKVAKAQELYVRSIVGSEGNLGQQFNTLAFQDVSNNKKILKEIYGDYGASLSQVASDPQKMQNALNDFYINNSIFSRRVDPYSLPENSTYETLLDAFKTWIGKRGSGQGLGLNSVKLGEPGRSYGDIVGNRQFKLLDETAKTPLEYVNKIKGSVDGNRIINELDKEKIKDLAIKNNIKLNDYNLNNFSDLLDAKNYTNYGVDNFMQNMNSFYYDIGKEFGMKAISTKSVIGNSNYATILGNIDEKMDVLKLSLSEITPNLKSLKSRKDNVNLILNVKDKVIKDVSEFKKIQGYLDGGLSKYKERTEILENIHKHVSDKNEQLKNKLIDLKVKNTKTEELIKLENEIKEGEALFKKLKKEKIEIDNANKALNRKLKDLEEYQLNLLKATGATTLGGLFSGGAWAMSNSSEMTIEERKEWREQWADLTDEEKAYYRSINQEEKDEFKSMIRTETWNPETQSWDRAKPKVKVPSKKTGGEFMEMELTDLEIAELKRQGYEIEDLP